MTDLPPEVAALLKERAAARARRDWATADELRDRLHQLGWEPVDGPSGSRARPRLAAAPVAVGYARPEDVASLLDEQPTLAASLVVLAEEHPTDLERFVTALDRHPPNVAWELVVVANAPPMPLPDPAGRPITILPTTTRLGWADAANLGLRRSRGAVSVLVDTSLEPVGEWLGPLLAAFDDESVGVAGPWGVASLDGRQFEEAPPGPVDAVEAYCLAIRREALRSVGGFDHRFRFYRNADLDLSFAVRDAGWRALRTPSLALVRHEHRAWSALPPDERDRLSRRNFYRFLKRWGARHDLLLARSGEAGPDRR